MHRFSPLPKLPLLVCVSVGVSMGLSVGCGDSKPKSSKSSIAAAFENQVDPKGKAKEAGEDMRKLKEKVAALLARALRLVFEDRVFLCGNRTVIFD